MTYKRIIEIQDANLAAAMADEAKHFGVTFRSVRPYRENAYVVEGPVSRRADIETIVDAVAGMDAEAREEV